MKGSPSKFLSWESGRWA